MAAQAASLQTETKMVKIEQLATYTTTQVALKVTTERHMLVDRMGTLGMILSIDHKECVPKSAVQTITEAAETSSLLSAIVRGTWP